jgi:[ribosomal protein S5]-alanine N-acetyltransferase
LRWPELLAITKPSNVRSQALLSKLGFVAEGERQLEGYDGPSSFWRMVL